MQDILFEYELNPTTWAYLSALLTVGIYFKFNRLFSLRNLDLLGLVFFSPGLLVVFHGQVTRSDRLVQLGYTWLFGMGLLFVIRLFVDPLLVRRPKLDPNLSAGGLTFTGISILVFLAANVVSDRPPKRLEHELAQDQAWGLKSPGYRPLYYLATYHNVRPGEDAQKQPRADWDYPPNHVQVPIARTVLMLAQLAVVLGMILIGYYHFESLHTGMAAAVLYLLLPYVGQMGGRIDHVVPAAALVWAMAAYRRPMVSGFLLGLAGGLIFYPLCLLPLGCSFYWQRGMRRYLAGTMLAIAALVVSLAFLAGSRQSFVEQLGQMFGATIFPRDNIVGFWQFYQPAYRIPVLALFAVLCGSLALWPAQKNFGTLVSCSATVMLASQFCQTFEGGLYMAWYLPLLVLTSFRPNLEDRVAVSTVIERRAAWILRLGQRMRRTPAPT